MVYPRKHFAGTDVVVSHLRGRRCGALNELLRYLSLIRTSQNRRFLPRKRIYRTIYIPNVSFLICYLKWNASRVSHGSLSLNKLQENSNTAQKSITIRRSDCLPPHCTHRWQRLFRMWLCYLATLSLRVVGNRTETDSDSVFLVST